MFPKNTADTWGPDCRLVRALTDLRNQTAHGRMGVVGIGTLYNRINETWCDDESMQLLQLTKGRIEALLKGEGLAPTWDEVRTLCKTLHRVAMDRFEVGTEKPPTMNEKQLRSLVEATEVLPPYKREVASHFASRILQFGQDHAVQYVQQNLRSRELWRKKNGYAPGLSTIAKQTREALQKHERYPERVIHGAVAIAHTDPAPPLYYENIFDPQIVKEIKYLQELKILRLDGHQIQVTVEYLETAVRFTYPISDALYVKAFVAVEVSSLGSVAVYFRWIPLLDDEQQRLEPLVGWGLIGAAQLCFHVQNMLGASGIANASYDLSQNDSGNLTVSLSTNPNYQFFHSHEAALEHFGHIVEKIAGVEDRSAYVRNALNNLDGN